MRATGNFIVNPNDTTIFNEITKYLLLTARTAACEETKATNRKTQITKVSLCLQHNICEYHTIRLT